MEPPVQIAFRNVPHSEALEEVIRERASHLATHFDRVVHCHVVLDVPHRHHQHGNAQQVRLDLKVPGGEIVVSREAGPHADCPDLYAAVRDAFDAAERQVEEHVRKRLRHDVKTHEPPAHARVRQVFAEEGYGFLTTADGRDIYFHRNALRDGTFDRLQIGAEVTFVEEDGDKGPQASTVRPVGRHNHHP